MAMNMNEISRKAKSGHGWTDIGEDITDCH